MTMGTRAQPPALPWQQAPPVAGTGARQSLQVAPSRERGPAGSGGGGGLGGLAFARPLPGPRLAAARPPAPTCEGHGPRATTAQGRATSAARLLFPDRPQARPACLAGPTHSRGTQRVPANTLRPARRPRKCGAAAKPRPAPPLFMGTVRRRPRARPLPSRAPPLPPAPGGDGHSALAAVPASPSRDLPPRQLGSPRRPRGLRGCALPDLGRPGLACPGPRRNRRKGVVLLLRSTTTQLAVLPRAGSLTSLSLRFFICKVGRTVETSQGCGEKCNYVGTQLAHGQLSIMAVLFPVRGK